MNTEQLTHIFIGPRAQKYMTAWANQSYRFCWAGLFFGLFWLLYRKMYMFAFYTLLISMAWVFVFYILGIPLIYAAGLNILISLVLSVFGDSFYRSFVNEKVKAFQANPKDGLEILRLSGGVTWSVPLTWLFLQLLAVVFVMLPIIQHTYFPQQQPDFIQYSYIE